MAAIFRGFCKLTWFCCKWGLMLAALSVGVGVPYGYHRLNEEVRRQVERKLADHYRDLLVTVRSARLQSDGIEIRGISIVEPRAPESQAELLAIDELYVYGNFDLVELVANRLAITRIVARQPTLRMTRRADGSWSGARLLPIPKFSDTPPEVTVEHGVVELFDPMKNPSSTLRLRDANVKIAPSTELASRPSTAAPGASASLRMQGTLASDYIRHISIDATFDPAGGAWQAAGTIDGMEMSAELVRAMPGDEVCRQKMLDGLRAAVEARFMVRHDPRAAEPWSFDVIGQFSRGRYDDPRLPYPLTELRGTFRFTPQNCSINDVSARSGQAALHFSVRRAGYADASAVSLQAEARRLVLDAKLMDLLPAKWQAEWHKYMPSGEVDLDVHATYDGHKWQPDVFCKCLNTSFTYHKFPYRLDRGRGTLELKQGRLALNLMAHSEEAELRLVGAWQVDVTPATGWVEMRGDNLRFDEKLLAAMPEATGRVVRSLRPFGQFGMSGKFWRGADAIEHRDLVMSFSGCSMKFDKFPYPLDQIRGTIEMHDGLWTLRGLQGANGTGHVECTGQILPAEKGVVVQLHLIGTQVLLEDELREALSPGAKQLWQDLKPRGTINLETHVRFEPGDREARLWVRAEPVGESVSIEPAQFPYRLEKMAGVFVFADGQVALDNLRAEHGRTQLTGRGQCDLLPAGGWRLSLVQLSVDRLVADRDLISALSGRLKKSLGELNLTGPVNLRGNVTLANMPVDGLANSAERFSSAWDVHLDLHRNTADVGLLLENMHGGMHLVGDSFGERFRCQGEVELDSLTCKQVQFTNVRGPLWLDETRLLLGFWADRQSAAPVERHLIAQLYGGAFSLDGWALFGSQAPYELHMGLERGDLARWKQESFGGREDLRGEIYAQLMLRGKGKSLNNLTGHGALELRNADIYELPAMVSLLKVLSVRQPDSVAFTSSDVRFRVQGEHIYVDRIDFSGDAISLLGKGEIGLNKQLHLVFHAMVGRDRPRLPVIGDVLGGASQQIMLIHAEGTLDQPTLRREAFPGVNQVLQQLQAELQARPQPLRQAAAEAQLIPPRH
ncbi:MAG TPA: hypothetical protein VHZ24_07460 [Pirellulales bacterium]|jgi:hypothetical protein|nr:hypothetical protein [Pirellulales bacterium]